MTPAHHHEPPRTDGTRHPVRVLLYSPLRPLARAIVRRRCAVRLHGAELVPAHGPVIFASNHIGVADGPLLGLFAPRPVHALTKSEMFQRRSPVPSCAPRARSPWTASTPTLPP